MKHLVAIGVAAAVSQPAGAGGFEVFGVGCPNRSGEPPSLIADGHSIAGGSVVLEFDGDAVRSQAFVFVGIGSAPPSPGPCGLELAGPIPLPLGPIQLDVFGDFTFPTTIPATLPTLFEFSIQVLEIDHQAPNGQFGISNGVRFEIDDGSAYPVPVWRLGYQPVDFAVGDLNGDSNLDVIGVESIWPYAPCFFGDGRGGFHPGPSVFAPTAKGDSAEVADLNGDGALDLAIASSALVIQYGNGDGTFGPLHYHGVGSSGSSPRVGDLDLDGDLDIVVVNGSKNKIYVLRATSAGTFPAIGEAYGVGSSPRRCAIGDLDQNGLPDIAVANSVGGTVSVLLSSSSGGFSTATSHSTQVQAWTIDIGDTDGSGGLDLIVGSAGADSIVVLPGDGVGGFGPAKTSPACSGTFDVASLAYDSDPYADVVVGTGFEKTLCVLRSDGNGQFVATATFDIGLRADAVYPADVDGDGAEEIVVFHANQSFGIVERDSETTFQAGESHSVYYMASGLAAADFDQDGRDDIVAGSRFGYSQYYGLVTYFQAASNDAFAAGVDLFASSAAYELACADIDGDGDFDFASAATLYGIEIWLGDGSGAFAFPVWIASQVTNTALAIADFDGDGLVDVVTTHGTNSGTAPGSKRLGRRLGTAGALWPNLVEYPMSQASDELVVGDFDADGSLDVVATHPVGSAASFYRGDSFGGFLPAIEFAVGLGPDAADAADLDRDGTLDLVVCRPGDDLISIFTNDGSGSFSFSSSHATGVGPTDLVLCDFDGDSDTDLVSIDGVTFSLALRRNDGHAAFGPPQLQAAGNFASDLVAANFDSDTTIDFAVLRSDGTNYGRLRILRHR